MPIAKAHQADAVRFLSENSFATPTWAIDKDVIRKIEPVGALNRIRNSQNSVLNNLLSSTRFARLVEQQALDGDAAYQPGDFLTDVRKSVWKELDGPGVKIDAYRRNLQRAYLDIANNKLNTPPAAAPQGLPAGFAANFVTSGDERGYYRSELRALNASVTAAIAKTTDRPTKVHLESVKDQIGKILNPELGGAANRTAFNYDQLQLFMTPSDDCWPDYIIRP